MEITRLTKEIVSEQVDDLINMIEDVPNEYWEKDHFLVDLNQKWELSIALINKHRKVKGFIIASKKELSVHIHKFMIDKDYRSQGYGAILLKQFENNCIKNEEEVLTLKVYKNNKKGIDFYLKHNFSTDTTFDELLLMKKYLKISKK